MTTRLIGRVGGSARSALQNEFARNTLFLTASTLMLGISGLAFWFVAVRTHSTSTVGVALAIVSALTLLISLTSAGWPQLATRDGSAPGRGEQIFARSAGFALLVGVTVVAILAAVPGHLGFAFDDIGNGMLAPGIVCGATVVLGACGSSLEGVLLSRRSANLILAENAVGIGARFTVLLLLPASGVFTLLVANLAGVAAAFLAALTFVKKTGFRPRSLVPGGPAPLGTDLTFAVGTGVPIVVALAPASLLPTLILHSLGASAAAYFAVALSIAYAVRMIPAVTAQTMLAEVGRGAAPRALLTKALTATSAFSVLASVVVIAAAQPLMSLYGASFSSEATPIVALLVASGALAGANYLLDGMLLALGHGARYSIVNVAGSVTVLTLVSLGAQHSIVAAGCGYIVAEIVYAAIGWLMLRSSSGWKAGAARHRVPSKSIEHASAVIAAEVRTIEETL